MWGVSQISERVVDCMDCSYEKYVDLFTVAPAKNYFLRNSGRPLQYALFFKCVMAL